MTMPKSILRKAAVAVATAGLVIVPAAGAATAAQPQAQAVAHYPGYYGKAETKADLKLSRSVGKQGQLNVARIKVSSGSGAPKGRVKRVVKGIGVIGTAVVRNGVATIRFGKALSAKRTYQIQAVFVGNKTFRGSSDTANYTVMKKQKPRHR
jgi:hypothetical protein